MALSVLRARCCGASVCVCVFIIIALYIYDYKHELWSHINSNKVNMILWHMQTGQTEYARGERTLPTKSIFIKSEFCMCVYGTKENQTN